MLYEVITIPDIPDIFYGLSRSKELIDIGSKFFSNASELFHRLFAFTHTLYQFFNPYTVVANRYKQDTS